MPVVIAVLTLFAALNMRTYRIVTGTLFAVLLMGEVSAATEPAEITLHIRGEYKGVVSALLEAADAGTPVTGIAELDSLAATYGLMGIYRKGRRSSFYGYRFRLTFPPGADEVAIAGAYWNLSYIQSVEPKPPPQARFWKKDIEDQGLRFLAKVAAGTVSSVVFTAIAMITLDRTWEPEEDPDADAYRALGLILAGGAIGCSVGFPLGVSEVDPYDSLPVTLLAGVIPGSVGLSLLRADRNEDTAFLLIYIVPVMGSLIVSEMSRKPPQDRRVSFDLSPTLTGGFSAVAQLRF